MQRGSWAPALTRPNDLLDLDPRGLYFTGELMHGLAGVLVRVGVHVELGLGELHCQVSKWTEEISTVGQPCWEQGHPGAGQRMGRGRRG